MPASGLELRRMRFSLSHLCDGCFGRPDPLFGYVVAGGAVITGSEGKMSLEKGDFFFLPARFSYRTVWSGDPFVEYLILSFTAPASFPGFAPALLGSLSGEKTYEKLLVIERSSSGNVSDRLLAAREFFGLFHEALPYLTESPKKELSPAVRAAADYIALRACENYSAADLARSVLLSESRLYHLFREELGVTPLEYRNGLRIERAAALIREGKDVKEIVSLTGFESDRYFRRVFKRAVGVTPGEYRKKFAEK
ncbi:MAG: helix-turn-helix transcriptional regulator [Clostridia bacterium]|nr:helix-turn-helix transcriptional regulator [Clostridia bacterium]